MKKKIYVTFYLFIFCILTWFLLFKFGNDGDFYISFLNVGQGDAIFIQTPDKFQVLIDGGPDNSVLSELSKLMPFYDREIDLLAFTHPQNDHIFGLLEVLKRYRVKNIIFSNVIYNNKTYDEIKKIIKKKNINVIDPVAGKRLKLGNIAFLDVLYPFKSADGIKVDNPNDVSLSLRLDYLGKRFLFSGDAELKEELDLVGSEINLDVDILKLNHHGSKTSNSKLFLESTTPEIAIISVGEKNSYNHPSDIVLKRLKNTLILRTDYNGRIDIFVDRSGFKYKTEF